MTNRAPRHAALAAALLLAAPPAGPGSAPPTDSERVAFRIRTFLGPAGGAATVSDATVDGPPGTDVTLDSRAGRFSMVAKLKTDVLADGRVRVVADVTTRRSAGTSERGLPLYEEDVQRRAVDLASDGSESLVVLPFGRNPGGDEVAIDVQPMRSVRVAPAPLSIRIDSSGPDGWLRVDAVKIPHRYDVVASLERDGREVARGAGRCEIGERGLVALAAPDGGPVAAIPVTVVSYTNACPADRVDIAFDVAAPDARTPLAREWAGVTSTGEPLSYDLGALGAKIAGTPTTLRLWITPVEGDAR